MACNLLGFPVVKNLDNPYFRFGGPVGLYYIVLKLDLLIDPEQSRRVPKIRKDGLGVGNGLLLVPGVPGKTKRVQVAITSNPRIFEEVPRAAYFIAALKYGV